MSIVWHTSHKCVPLASALQSAHYILICIFFQVLALQQKNWIDPEASNGFALATQRALLQRSSSPGDLPESDDEMAQPDDQAQQPHLQSALASIGHVIV